MLVMFLRLLSCTRCVPGRVDCGMLFLWRIWSYRWKSYGLLGLWMVVLRRWCTVGHISWECYSDRLP
uniref:Uncharacterized protein n=1 Tax=Anopheles marajoara TaxID=58244 RepID=A0A2M4CFV5_9DIPT